MIDSSDHGTGAGGPPGRGPAGAGIAAGKRPVQRRHRGANGDEMIALRCERMPALIIVGFRKHAGVTTGFPTAIKSLVALRHVDPPKPWGEGPENESLADEVLDELSRHFELLLHDSACALIVLAFVLLLMVGSAGAADARYRGRFYFGPDVQVFEPCRELKAYWVDGDAKTALP